MRADRLSEASPAIVTCVERAIVRQRRRDDEEVGGLRRSPFATCRREHLPVPIRDAFVDFEREEGRAHSGEGAGAPRPRLVVARQGRGTFVASTLAPASLRHHDELRAALVRWLGSALAAGLDEESIRALISATLRESLARNVA